MVLPYLVPQLTASPVNTKALSILGSVAGEALNRHLARILPALLTSLAESHGKSNEAQELQYCQVGLQRSSMLLGRYETIGASMLLGRSFNAARNELQRRNFISAR